MPDSMTFYPDAHPETSSFDGYVDHLDASGLTWDALHDGDGNNSDDTSTGIVLQIGTHSDANRWQYFSRPQIVFDTSALPDGATVTSAILSIYGAYKTDALGIAPDINVYSANPASITGISLSDYQNSGITAYCDTPIAYADFDAAGWNSFTLNAAGLAAITTGSGGSKFCIRNANYDVADIEPSWSSNKESSFWFQAAENVTNIPKLVVYYTAPPPTDFVFLQATADPANASVYTFSAQNLGAADADRYIIVSAVARKAGAATTISSITVGGEAATIVKQVTNTITNTDVAGLAIAAVPTGTTGDIVVTFGATMVRCAIGVWRVVGIDSPTPTDSDSSTANDPTCSLNIPAGGFAIGAGLTANANSATWTGLTEDYDGQLEAYVTYTGASDEFVSEQTGLTITIDFTTSVESAGVFASWGSEEAPPVYYHGLKVQGVGELALCDVGTHPLRIRKGGTTYGIELVATDDPNASSVRVKTGVGIKAVRKYT